MFGVHRAEDGDSYRTLLPKLADTDSSQRDTELLHHHPCLCVEHLKTIVLLKNGVTSDVELGSSSDRHSLAVSRRNSSAPHDRSYAITRLGLVPGIDRNLLTQLSRATRSSRPQCNWMYVLPKHGTVWIVI
jgi:hypothetical protein